MRPAARPFRSALRLALLGIAASTLAAVGPSTAASAASTLPAGFQESVVISGLTNPIAVRFASDGRVFVAEKSGRIKVYDGLGDATPDVFANLSSNVHDFWDRGMLGFTLDPNFPSTPYVYVLYAYDAPIGGTPPTWGDACPNPPGATGDGCVISGRLSRLQASGNQMVGPEQVMIEDWCQQYPSHSIGSLAFGSDGALYVSGGDGASFNFTDYGQDGNPLNPCGDPPAAVGGTQTPPTAEGGALRSQDLRTSSDPTTLDGSILRVDPATGAALASNPGAGDAHARRIVAHGFRNPFRFTIRPGTSEVWIGDVGWNTWEEIDRLQGPASAPVENFGWPCYEGVSRQPGYDGADLNVCENLYGAGAGAISAPYYAYNHSAKVVTGESCPAGSSSISGLAFYQGGPYPGIYDGALFFADYSRDCIWAMRPGGNGLPDPTNLATFVAGAANPVDLQIGTGGDLFYADLDGGSIRRITYSAGNQAPTALATADPTSGSAPLTVDFDGTQSSDPDAGDVISYAWDLDGDGQYDDATAPQPTWTYNAPGTYTVRLRVADGDGASSVSGPITISANNTAPTVTIDTPASSTTWGAGENLSFSGHATDPQQGALGPAALSWSLTVQHNCPSANCHSHLVQTFPGVAGGSFGAPDHEYPSYLELSVTATDAGGLQDTETLRLDPRTVKLTFDSSPGGVDITLDGSSDPAPFERTVIEGSRHSISSPESLAGPPGRWFSSWSDGGARAHDVTAPTTAATYTATYVENQSPVAATQATPSAGDAPLDVAFSGAGSSDPDAQDSIVSYAWDLDGDGQFDDSAASNPSMTYGVGSHTVRLRVTDELGATDADELSVVAHDSHPEGSIDGPLQGSTWTVGERIAYSGHATDQQDGTLNGSAMRWRVSLCTPSGCTVIHRSVGAEGSFTVPSAPYPCHLEIAMTATDSGGLTDTDVVVTEPRVVKLMFRSAPVGRVPLRFDGASRRSSFSRTAIVGSTHVIRAPARITRAGEVRTFLQWSDGGARVHRIGVDEIDRVYLATYRRPVPS